MGKLNEKQYKFIQELVLRFASVEEEIHKEWHENKKYEESFEDFCVLMTIGLVNYMGNFIFHHSKDEQSRITNFNKFFDSLEMWIHERTKFSKKH